jgi:YD repeat-containing protein
VLTWPDGFTLTTDYDALERPVGIRANGAALAAYGYDPLSRRTALAYANAAETTYAYEPDDDLAALVHHFADHTIRLRFTYDGAGQRTAADVSDPSFLWLPGASASIDYSANALNQYATVTGFAPSYDANGNLTGDGTRRFAYDPDNRLTRVSAGTQTLAGHAYESIAPIRCST